MTLFALFAFSLQSYVTQVHIHGAAGTVASASASGKSAARKQEPDKFPPADDPANCPICQEILHAGHYIAPSADAWTPLEVAPSTATVVTAAAAIVRLPSHGWKSRAPPLA